MSLSAQAATQRNPTGESIDPEAFSRLRSEIESFSIECGLTKREREIVAVLALGQTRIKDIAGRLGVSPNTINNHMNSVFFKTRSRSKSEVIAKLLVHVAHRLYAELARCRTRALFVGDALESASRELSQFGVDGYWLASREQAAPWIGFGDIDYAVMDARSLSDMPWPRSLWETPVSGLLAPKPILCGGTAGVRAALGAGYVDCIAEASTESIADVLGYHSLRSREARRRHRRQRWHAARPASTTIEIPRSRWGRGGFVATAEELNKSANLGALEAGDAFEVQVRDGADRWLGDAQVAWIDVDAPSRPHGLRFWPHQDGLEWRGFLAAPASNHGAFIPASI